MVVDVGEIRKHIKPKADSTLRNMGKDDLINYVRILEHNYDVAQTFLDQQAKNFENYAPVVHGHWFLTEPEYLNCSVCGNPYYTGIETLSAELDHLEYAGGPKFCPNCGATMDGEKDG